MKRFVVYNAEGVILRAGMCDDAVLKKQASATGESVLQADGNDADHYVDLSGETPKIAPRVDMEPEVETDVGQATLSNLPDPCIVDCNGHSVEATGGEITATFDEPGAYDITVRAAPQYRDCHLTVEVP